MVSGKIQKMYTVVSFNESRTELNYVQLTVRQLEKILPIYIIGILVKGLSHLLSIDGKFKKYSFSYMTIDSTNCLAVKIDLDRFTKLFPAGSFTVLTKIRETEVEQEIPSSKTTKHSTSRGSKAPMRVIHRGSAQISASSPNISKLVYCKRIFNYPYNDNYSLMFRPKTFFTRA
jgi:hypothetical protein